MSAATPWLKLPLVFDADRMREDLARIPDDAWISHYNTGAYETGWSCVPLRSAEGRADHILALEDAAYEDTRWLDRCPNLREVIAQFQCDKTSVRLMALEAGAIVDEHRDPGTAMEEGITRVHVPIATTPQALMRIEGEVVHFAAGHAWYLNAACLHGVENRGATARVHLMIDCVTNDWVREVFAAAGGVNQQPLSPEERALLRGKAVPYEPAQSMAGWSPATFTAGRNGQPEIGWRFGDERRVCRTPIDALDACEGIAPTAFIFHVSRCGSTLLTEMLATLGSCIALSEPPVLDAFFRFHHRDPAASDGARTLRGLVAALGQRRTGRERHCVIKLDSWHLAWAGWLRELFPRTPFVVLYRDPREVLASHRRQRGRHMVPGFTDMSRLKVDMDGLAPGNMDGYAARVLASVYAQAVDAAADRGTRLVNYTQLPEAVANELMPALDIECGDDERRALLARARFHSKHAESRFDGDPVEAGLATEAQVRQALECYERLEALRLRPSSCAPGRSLPAR